MSDRPEYKAAWYQYNKERVRKKRNANKKRYREKPRNYLDQMVYLREWRMFQRLVRGEEGIRK
jgi:hypothetical protein